MSLYFLYGAFFHILAFNAPTEFYFKPESLFELRVNGERIYNVRTVAHLIRPEQAGKTVKKMVIRGSVDSTRVLSLVYTHVGDNIDEDCLPKTLFFDKGKRNEFVLHEEQKLYNDLDAFYWGREEGVYYSQLKSRGWGTIHKCVEPRQRVWGCFDLKLKSPKQGDKIHLKGCFANIHFQSYL